MKKLLEDLKALGIVLLLLVAVFFVGRCQGVNKTQEEYELLLDQSVYEHDESIRLVENERLKLSDLLDKSNTDNQSLRQIIAQAEIRPAQIRYITRTETVVVGTEVTQQSCPENHTFLLECGMPVAQIEKTGDAYRLSTASLTFKAETVIAEDATATKLTASSSLDPDTEYELPVTEFHSFKQKEFQTLHPELSLIGTTHIPSFNVSAGLEMPWLHITEQIDLASPRLTLNNQNAYLGIDLISYQIGKPIPLIEDVWLGAGVSMSTSLDKSIDVSISSKL